MADIKPMLEELKGKIPSKEQILKTIQDMSLHVDTNKIKSKTDAIQGQILNIAIETSKNPKLQSYAKSVLSADVTNKAILKLKETLPNQAILDQLDEMRLAFIRPKKEQQTEESPPKMDTDKDSVIESES